MTKRRCEVDLGDGAVIRFDAYDFAKLEEKMGMTTPEIYQEAHKAWVEGRASALVGFLDVGLKLPDGKTKADVVLLPIVDLALQITDAMTLGYYGKTLEELANEQAAKAERGEVDEDEGKPTKATGSEILSETPTDTE